MTLIDYANVCRHCGVHRSQHVGDGPQATTNVLPHSPPNPCPGFEAIAPSCVDCGAPIPVFCRACAGKRADEVRRQLREAQVKLSDHACPDGKCGGCCRCTQAQAEGALADLRGQVADLARRLRETQLQCECLVAATPADIRAKGWVVAIHNDYFLDGAPYTFWLFTRASPPGARAGFYLKGEGVSDAIALAQVRAEIAAMEQCR